MSSRRGVPGRGSASTGDPHITPGQRRVVEALLGVPNGITYDGVASALGISRGTVYAHLRRLRTNWPELYADVMAIRCQQLAARHAEALRRATTLR